MAQIFDDPMKSPLLEAFSKMPASISEADQDEPEKPSRPHLQRSRCSCVYTQNSGTNKSRAAAWFTV